MFEPAYDYLWGGGTKKKLFEVRLVTDIRTNVGFDKSRTNVGFDKSLLTSPSSLNDENSKARVHCGIQSSSPPLRVDGFRRIVI